MISAYLQAGGQGAGPGASGPKKRVTMKDKFIKKPATLGLGTPGEVSIEWIYNADFE